MSVETKLKDVTVNTFFKKKENNEKITIVVPAIENKNVIYKSLRMTALRQSTLTMQV